MATGQGASLSEGLDEKDLRKLYEALYRVRTSYMAIGLVIGVQISEIEGVESKQTDSGRRLLGILTIRLRQTEKLMWGDIVEALRSECVGQGKVADEIEKKYCLAATAEGKQHEKQVQFNIRKSQRGNKQKELHTEGDPPMNKEKVSDKQDSDSEGEGSEKVKRKSYLHSKAKRKGVKLVKVESNDEKKRKRRSKQKGEPPLYQEEVSYEQDSDSEGEGSERVKQKIYSEKPRSKTTRKGEKVREKAEMSVAHFESERETERRKMKATYEKEKSEVVDDHSADYNTNQKQKRWKKVNIESDNESSTSSSDSEIVSPPLQSKRKRKLLLSSTTVSEESDNEISEVESKRKAAMPKQNFAHKKQIENKRTGDKRIDKKVKQLASGKEKCPKRGPKSSNQSKKERERGIPQEKKAAVVPLEPATDDSSQEASEKDQEWDSDESEEEEDSEQNEEEETGPGSEHNQVVKKRGRGIPSEKKAAAVPLEPTSVDSSQEESGEETRDLDDRSEYEDSEQKSSSEEEETEPDGESSAASN